MAQLRMLVEIHDKLRHTACFTFLSVSQLSKKMGYREGKMERKV